LSIFACFLQLPEVATLISLLLATPDEELSTVLVTVPSWPWPRGDLHSWTQVLNKFDEILEKTITEYDIKTIQVNEFTPRTKQTVLEILRFEKMLLEHCTNRKIYASFDVSTVSSSFCCRIVVELFGGGSRAGGRRGKEKGRDSRADLDLPSFSFPSFL